jgi:hypothetical protein
MNHIDSAACRTRRSRLPLLSHLASPAYLDPDHDALICALSLSKGTPRRARRACALAAQRASHLFLIKRSLELHVTLSHSGSRDQAGQ